ncbi:MAG TPA: peptidylprolyl isomerase [Vicinamibacterales bacterium]|nr:peptidylprolyl isomerase [Vicinamibacterales bacterium]
MTKTIRTSLIAIATAAAMASPGVDVGAARAGNPILDFETQKGTFTIELYQADAPKSVAHILALVKKNFYRGQRFHRVEASLAQFGDPGTRDMSRIDYWGSGNSGAPIGVAENLKKYKHVRGTVAMANSGDARSSDSQLYIMKAASPSLDGKYIIVGRVTSGMAVVDKIVKTDRIVNVTIKAAGQP